MVGSVGFSGREKVFLMLCSNSAPVISVSNVSKCYHVYGKPSDRLKQFIIPIFCRILGIDRRRYFSEFWALRDVSLNVSKGETIGVIGRNGSGKSTLLQLICGTLTQTAGDVAVVGRVAALLELGSGFNPEFSGKENVYLNAALLGLSLDEIDARFQAIVAFADIGEFIDQPVKTYSSGMMVRLAFAVIAHVDADVLIIDEALAVGDAFFTQKCMRFLREFMSRGTVLFVSHDTAAIKSLCDRVVWLHEGKLVAVGSPKDVCEAYLESYVEAGQGESKVEVARLEELPAADSARDTKSVNDAEEIDQRIKYINTSNLRNDLRVHKFRTDGKAFGKGGARIVNVSLVSDLDRELAWVVGGEIVVIRIVAEIYERMESPIIGFAVKDRLGQELFGDNTFLTYLDSPVTCRAGNTVTARFSFRMPIMPVGDYVVYAAIADGTQSDHVQHHWIHDALSFRSESTSSSTGLVGIPMREISLECENG